MEPQNTTSRTARTIAALRATHEELAALVATLTDAQLRGPSGAAQWKLADVLSHLGSGAEIGLAGLRATLDDEPAPGRDFNLAVWDRWNAAPPREQAEGFVASDAALLAAYEGLSADQQETLRVRLGFAPAPLSLAGAAGLRLNEAVAHGWDVRVALDPHAGLTDEAALLLAQHFAGELGFLLGFIGKPAEVAEPVVLDLAGSGFGIVIGEQVSLTSSVSAVTASFAGPFEAGIRLISGRLKPQFTPTQVEVTGNVTLDELRRVFPGY